MEKTRILIVEDDRLFTQDLEYMLQSLGCDVVAAVSSGEEAIKKAAESSPDLVLMDIRLDGNIDGIGASKKIGEQSSIPVIYLTAHSDEATLQRARLTEPFGYLIKPLNQRDLQTTIEVALYKSQVEMKLRKKEQLLSSILDNIGDGLISTNAEGFISFMSPLAEKLTGWKSEDALGKDLKEIFHLLDENGQIVAQKYMTKALSEGDIVNSTDRHLLIKKTGAKIPIRVTASPIRTGENNITGAIISFRDVTEHEKKEDSLRRERETTKRIFASSPDAIMIISLNLKLKDCNQAALHLLGYSTKKEILDKDVLDFFEQKDQPRVREDIKRVLEKNLLKDIEYTCQNKNGDEIIVLVSLSVVRETSGDPLHFVAVAKDITRIKLSKQMLETIFDGMRDGILIVNANYDILKANQEILKVFNKKSFSALIGKSCFSQLYKKKRICDNCPAEMAFKSGKPHYAVRIYCEENKEKRVLDLTAFPIKDSDGKVVQVIVHKKDVTDRIKLEDQLISQERMVAIGELASGIAHEIRNPLGNIFVSVQYCLSKYKLPRDVKRYLKIVLKNSENANTVIRHLLNFAKPQEISFERGDIGKVITAACNLIKVKCLSQRVRMIRRLPRGLPRILLDQRRLIEAFSNIILNAIDAMPDGGRLRIEAWADSLDNEIVISILDTGAGISQENLNKIFEPFFTTKPEGIGLGLCLARQVINDHKGKIEIESKVNQGTEVRVRLPIFRT
jgi:PAS domain S-box-containing protein